MGESKFDPAPHLAELIDGVKELAARGGDQRYLAQLLTGPYAALRGGLLLDEPGREGTSTANAIREAMTGYKPTEIGFVIWDPNTDGVAILERPIFWASCSWVAPKSSSSARAARGASPGRTGQPVHARSARCRTRCGPER